MMDAYWVDREGAYHAAVLDPRSGAANTVRDTRGGEFFYRFHFELALPYPWGRWLAAACAMATLVALVSGIIIHKRIFKDFFVFRPHKGARRAWLDAHNVSSVLVLRFHVMIAFTGLVTLMVMLMPWGMLANYGSNLDRFYAERYGDSFAVTAAGAPAQLAQIAPVLRDADQRLAEPIGRMLVERPGDANARIEIFSAETGRIGMRPPRSSSAASLANFEKRASSGGRLPSPRTSSTACTWAVMAAQCCAGSISSAASPAQL